MTSPNRQASDVQWVHASTCGFEGVKGKEPKVCCPITEILTNSGQLNNNGSRDHEGKYEQQNFGLEGGNNSIIEQKGALPEVLPSDCGTYLSNRILGGTATELDEYPWLSLLEYRKCKSSFFTSIHIFTSINHSIHYSYRKNSNILRWHHNKQTLRANSRSLRSRY